MQDAIKNKSGLLKKTPQRWVLLAGMTLLSIGSATTYAWLRIASVKQETPAPVTAPVIKTVTALGRLAPHSEVIKLSAPTANQGSRVDRLLVKEGDRVKAGQVIALLDSHERLKAALAEAEQEVGVAQAKLAVTQAGAKQGEIAAQRAEIDRLAADHQGNIRLLQE